MLKEIIENIIDELESADVENVYSAFDAYSVENKGDIFTVVGLGAFETVAPIYSMAYSYIPFRAETDFSVTASKNMTMVELYDYYSQYIEPVLLGMTDLNCKLKKMSLKFDSNIKRLVMNVRMDINGIKKLERGNS